MINKKINIKGILIKFCLIYAFFLNYNILFSNDVKWTSSSSLASSLNKISSNGDYYVYYNSGIKVLNIRQGLLISVFEEDKPFNQNEFLNYEFSTNNENLYILSKKQIQIWNIKNATLLNKYEFKENNNEFEFIGIVKPVNQEFFVGLGYNINEPNHYKVITWGIENFIIQNSIDVNIGDYKLNTLDISPNGNFLCINLYNSNVEPAYSSKIYNLNEGQLVDELNSELKSTKLTDKYFACFTSFRIRLYNLNDFSLSQEIVYQGSEYVASNHFDISKDGKFLLYINLQNDNQLDVYNIESKEVEYSLNPKFTKLEKFYFFNEDTVILETCDDERVPIAELINGKTNSFIRQIFNGNKNDYIQVLHFSKDGNYIWVLYPSGSISMYETETGKLNKNILFNDFPIESSNFNVDNENKYLAYSGEEKGISILDIENETISDFDTQDYTRFFELSFSSDGKSLLSASYKDSVVIIWDVESKAAQKIKKLNFKISKVFYTNDENNVYILALDDDIEGSILYKWDLSSDELTSNQIFFYFSENSILTVSEDKRYIVNSNSVYDIIDNNTTNFTPKMGVSGFSISNNNNFIALTNTGYYEDSVFIRVLDWKNDKIIKDYNIFNNIIIKGDMPVNRYQFSYLPRISPNNEYVAAISQLQDIALFKFDTTSSAVEEYQETNTYEAKVFPNPASNIVNLDLSLPSSGVVNVTIRDVQGVAVIENYSEFFASGKANIPFNLPKLSSGMYFVTVSFNTETTTIPLIIIN